MKVSILLLSFDPRVILNNAGASQLNMLIGLKQREETSLENLERERSSWQVLGTYLSHWTGRDWDDTDCSLNCSLVKAFNGWLTMFLTGQPSIPITDINHVGPHLSGFNTVPVKISMMWDTEPVYDGAELISGIMGFTYYLMVMDLKQLSTGYRQFSRITCGL